MTFDEWYNSIRHNGSVYFTAQAAWNAATEQASAENAALKEQVKNAAERANKEEGKSEPSFLGVVWEKGIMPMPDEESANRIAESFNGKVIRLFTHPQLPPEEQEELDRLRKEVVRLETIADKLLNHCDKDNGECSDCGRIVCPSQDPMHFHHDGCPSCYTPDGTGI